MARNRFNMPVSPRRYSFLPLTMPQESIHHLAIQIADVKMFLLKPSTEIGDHHDLLSDRVPRVALLGHGSSVGVKVLAQRSMA